MSSDIAWAITRNNSAFLLKKRNCPKPFSTDPMNLTNKHSQRYVGLVNKKAVAIAPASDNKGFTVTIKKGSGNRPGKGKVRSWFWLLELIEGGTPCIEKSDISISFNCRVCKIYVLNHISLAIAWMSGVDYPMTTFHNRISKCKVYDFSWRGW